PTAQCAAPGRLPHRLLEQPDRLRCLAGLDQELCELERIPGRLGAQLAQLLERAECGTAVAAHERFADVDSRPLGALLGRGARGEPDTREQGRRAAEMAHWRRSIPDGVRAQRTGTGHTLETESSRCSIKDAGIRR